MCRLVNRNSANARETSLLRDSRDIISRLLRDGYKQYPFADRIINLSTTPRVAT
jgi:hypothetical protein